VNFPNHQYSWKVLGAIFKKTGRMTESLFSLQKAVWINPKDAASHNNLSNVLREIGKLEESEASCRQAIALNPRYVSAHYNLGITLQELGRFEEAELSYRQAIKLNPGDAKAHLNLGNILKELGRLKEAELSYRQAVALKPAYTEAHNNLGTILQELGRFEGAINSYNTAERLDPNLDYKMNISAAHLKNGDPKNALLVLEKFLEKNPQDTRANAYKSIALRGLGKFEKFQDLINFPNLVIKSYIQTLTSEDMINFNKELLLTLAKDPRRTPEINSRGWAIRGGTVIRNLFNSTDYLIEKFRTLLLKSIDTYIAGLPNNSKHPFLMMKPKNYHVNCWVNFLEAGDYQSNHIHDIGWMSGVYYLSVPEIEIEKEHSGWIEFNRAGYNLPHFAGEKGIELIKPEEGLFIFFPSYVWHRTIPFLGSHSRISISFDISFH
jgi:uncharacterized protein (TIGR02466 family)